MFKQSGVAYVDLKVQSKVLCVRQAVSLKLKTMHFQEL